MKTTKEKIAEAIKQSAWVRIDVNGVPYLSNLTETTQAALDVVLEELEKEEIIKEAERGYRKGIEFRAMRHALKAAADKLRG